MSGQRYNVEGDLIIARVVGFIPPGTVLHRIPGENKGDPPTKAIGNRCAVVYVHGCPWMSEDGEHCSNLMVWGGIEEEVPDGGFVRCLMYGPGEGHR